MSDNKLFLQHLNTAMNYLYRARYVVTEPMDTEAFHDVVKVQEALQKVLSKHEPGRRSER